MEALPKQIHICVHNQPHISQEPVGRLKTVQMPCCSECGLQTSSARVPWERVRDAFLVPLRRPASGSLRSVQEVFPLARSLQSAYVCSIQVHRSRELCRRGKTQVMNHNRKEMDQNVNGS